MLTEDTFRYKLQGYVDGLREAAALVDARREVWEGAQELLGESPASVAVIQDLRDISRQLKLLYGNYKP